RPHLRALVQRYPRAKFIVIGDVNGAASSYRDGGLDELRGADVVHLCGRHTNTWRALCEHVRLPPPAAPYPAVPGIGQRKHRAVLARTSCRAKRLRHDRSPWVAESHAR